MALKTLIFGVDDVFNELKPYYAREIEHGNLEVVGYGIIENGNVTLVDATGKRGGGGTFSRISVSDNFFATKFLSEDEIFRGSWISAH